MEGGYVLRLQGRPGRISSDNGSVWMLVRKDRGGSHGPSTTHFPPFSSLQSPISMHHPIPYPPNSKGAIHHTPSAHRFWLCVACTKARAIRSLSWS